MPGQTARWPIALAHRQGFQVDPGADTGAQILRGSYYDINERKQLEARLLSVNETWKSVIARPAGGDQGPRTVDAISTDDAFDCSPPLPLKKIGRRNRGWSGLT
jgi:hypothetical protein